ncbi:MAG: hypothetical protein BWY06_01476 [Candidatus Latescibacteria bacterium ADurb.Bin168]|nr:MAG: hypothetical protein BWY06_01476 [Candidatus Latescibacteria bacterium ADurb.Bin168]
MRSETRGASTSEEVEISNISQAGIWLYVLGHEHFLPFDEFPWFRNATVGAIHNVELHHGIHLRWPDLDVDLEIDSLTSPHKYPLRYE